MKNSPLKIILLIVALLLTSSSTRLFANYSNSSAAVLTEEVLQETPPPSLINDIRTITQKEFEGTDPIYLFIGQTLEIPMQANLYAVLILSNEPYTYLSDHSEGKSFFDTYLKLTSCDSGGNGLLVNFSALCLGKSPGQEKLTIMAQNDSIVLKELIITVLDPADIK